MNTILKSPSDFRESFIYKVEEGESLSDVAEKFHTTITVVISENCLTEEPTAGQYIVVTKIHGKKHVVMPKDDIFSLAGGDKNRMLEITSKNKIDELYVGQTIYL